jgi:hypothetical protein
MSVEPPNECDSAIFNATCWIGDPTLTGNYVEFPVAQGNNTLLDLTVDNIAVTDSVEIDGGLEVTGESTLGSLNVTENSINNVATSGNVAIANTQTTGVLSIATANSRSGNINIGSTSGTTQTSNMYIGTNTTGEIQIGGGNTPVTITTNKWTLSSQFGLGSDYVFDISLVGGLSLSSDVGTEGQVFTSQGASEPYWSTIIAPSTNGTAGQLLTSNATSTPVFSTIVYPTTNGTAGQLLTSNATSTPVFSTIVYPTTNGTAGQILTSNATSTPVWAAAPVSINYKTDTIVPSTALSGSYLFTTVGGTPFTATPKITLTGFVSAGTTIVVVGVSAKSNLGFSWLASSTGLAGIDYIAVQS